MSIKETNLGTLIAQEPVASFAYADSLLARVTLCYSPERCAVLLSAHHVATDGKTNFRIVEDLIAVVSGESLENPFPLVPAVREFFEFGEPEPYSELASAKAPPCKLRLRLPVPEVRRRLLSAKDLKVL